MRLISFSKAIGLKLIILVIAQFPAIGQDISDYKIQEIHNSGKSTITQHKQFNGYTNHWHDDYTQWHRYGNLFKMARPDLHPIILQSKVDIAEDLGLPGLLMQEGFLSQLFLTPYRTIENPALDELEKALVEGNTLVITDPETEVGRLLGEKADTVFKWADKLQSNQFGAVGLETIKAFYLVNGKYHLFVISSSSKKQIKHLKGLIENADQLLNKYRLHKGWLGITTLLKTVTCTPGHPLDIIGKGMNEGHSWFIFDGYMARYGKEELEGWVSEVNLPVVADVGTSSTRDGTVIYGCDNYDGFQIQDNTASKQVFIDYAHKKGGYAFRPVYDPESDKYQYDGYIAHPGNKEQIDNENIPFINRAGSLNGDMTSSMVLFIEKEKPLTKKSIWDAIMNRKAVAVLEEAKMMGPAQYRNALQLLYLDKEYLEDYYNDELDMQAEVVDGYNLVVTLKNYGSSSVTGSLKITTSKAIEAGAVLPGFITLDGKESRQFSIPLQPDKDAMGRTNSVAVDFSWGKKKKSTVAMLDLPPVISMHQLLYAHAPEVDFPVTIHNFSERSSFPVEIVVFEKNKPEKEVFHQTKTDETATADFKELVFQLQLNPGEYMVRVNALGTTSESQLGVGKAEGRPHVYKVDLNDDGTDEYRMENDSVQITLLKTGARVIEYIVKSKNDNVLFKIWPEKTYNHNSPFRMRGFYPYGGFEDFLGQASMETHENYDAKIIQEEGDYVQVEMEADYYGNHLKKIFTLYGNSPLLEVRFELTFKNPEANMLGPQPILELGKNHGTEDVFIVPAMKGHKEYRMLPEQRFGRAIDLKEGWNAGYDSTDDISFAGAFPVTQPVFLHMWMNTSGNRNAPHYYLEFQPWVPIIKKSKMYFSYYLWGSGGAWQNSVKKLRERNLITTR